METLANGLLENGPAVVLSSVDFLIWGITAIVILIIVIGLANLNKDKGDSRSGKKDDQTPEDNQKLYYERGKPRECYTCGTIGDCWAKYEYYDKIEWSCWKCVSTQIEESKKKEANWESIRQEVANDNTSHLCSLCGKDWNGCRCEKFDGRI